MYHEGVASRNCHSHLGYEEIVEVEMVSAFPRPVVACNGMYFRLEPFIVLKVVLV